VGPLSLVNTTEELLGRNNSGAVLEGRAHGRGDPLRWPRDILYPRKFTLTSLTSRVHWVGIVRSRTKATELVNRCKKENTLLFYTTNNLNKNGLHIYIYRVLIQWTCLLMFGCFLLKENHCHEIMVINFSNLNKRYLLGYNAVYPNKRRLTCCRSMLPQWGLLLHF
jgi:hypothetical protein